jgi:hypothetical protein
MVAPRSLRHQFWSLRVQREKLLSHRQGLWEPGRAGEGPGAGNSETEAEL